MEQFSSCYFCGDAVDASLDEYPVVPASVDPEAGNRRTIVLCTNCKRKLDPVVEAVVDAVGDAAVTVDRSATDLREQENERGESDGDSGRDGGDGSASASDIGTTLGDNEDVLKPVGDDDSSEERGDAGESDESEQKRNYSSGQRAGGRPTGQGDGGDDGDEDETDEGGQRDVSLTRLENTNVMRLLQNREFPVDRDEFVTVASSAYEIAPSHCEKVLDLAVEHNLLREQNGELHAGAEWS